jgi:serine/threonine-protein kinase
MTTPERWQEIDRLFAAALELEPGERQSFLDRVCAGDEQLRKEVESLIAHDIPETLAGSHDEVTRMLGDLTSEVKESIGPYRIIRTLGVGGMGYVYLCHDSRLNRSVALKLLSCYQANEEERIRRFKQEALAASALNHPNILTIYEVGEFEGKNFIASEFVDGLTLRRRMDAGSISISECLDIATQIANALSAAHAAGIIHRDIKPENVMVRSDGLVKVLDFGVAKYTRQAKENLDLEVETIPGTVIGTAAYMSPEQARGMAVDVRTDIWSLGAVLYEMITRRRPFTGDTAVDVLAAVVGHQPPPFSTNETGLIAHGDLTRIIFTALKKKREGRYQTATELLIDLRALSKKLELTTQDEHHQLNTKITPQAETSIAVLPFVNMSGDLENEYFCDGLAEELLNALTKIGSLKVAARTSAFSFKGKNTNVNEIGLALGVNKILEGSVRKSGDQLRITVQLINASDGYHLWSERYDRSMRDIFDLQDEITIAVVDALKMKLLGNEKAAVLKRYTDNAEAYELYLKGRYHWYRLSPEDVEKSRNYFQQAIDLEPTYALGYAGLSEYYGIASALGLMPPDVGWPRSEATMLRAQELDNTLAEVHNGFAAIRMMYYRDWRGAESELKQAIELNPKLSEVRLLYSVCLVGVGRLDDAIAECKRALQLDPLSTRHGMWLGNWLYFARHYDEAIKQYREVLELDPNNFFSHEPLGDVYERKGMCDDAIAEWQRSMTLTGDADGSRLIGEVYQEKGFAQARRELIERKLVGMNRQIESGEYIPAGAFAREYARLGDKLNAFQWLEKTVEERNLFALLMNADPVYDTLREDARFEELVRSVKFT